MKAGVVIPIYKEVPNELEQVSLNSCLKFLGAFPVYLVVPKDLDRSWYIKLFGDKHPLFFEEFEWSFFNSGIAGYNTLMLSSDFYRRFLKFDYILIFQLDALVFNNCLDFWCRKGYDYIGAPWINADWLKQYTQSIYSQVLRTQGRIRRKWTIVRYKLWDVSRLCVGNGGLSLRKVSRFYKASVKHCDVIKNWGFNEDLFWGIYLPLYSSKFKVPSKKKALRFAFDINPALCYKLNKRKLPFGAHAWYREDFPYNGNYEFWKRLIKSYPNLPEL